MSDNKLNYDNTNTQIKQQRNAINPDMSKKLNIRVNTALVDDSCCIDTKIRQSVAPGNYKTANFYSCECLMPEVVDMATNQTGLHFKNGVEIAPCVVDDNSIMRQGQTKQFPKCPQQLFTRPYLTTPYMGRGVNGFTMPAEELNLQTGEDTSMKRPCNTLSGITIEHQWAPLIPIISNNIQNPIHIIEEEHGWVRGGLNSSLLIQDYDYAARCGKMPNKVLNEEFWLDKHHNL